MCVKCYSEGVFLIAVAAAVSKMPKPSLRTGTTDMLGSMAADLLLKTGDATASLQVVFNVAYEMGYRKATADANAKLEALDKMTEVM